MKKKDNRSKSGLGGGKPTRLFWAGILILILSGGVFLWVRIPLSMTEVQLNFPDIDLPGGDISAALQASELEERYLVLSYPKKIPVGRQGIFSIQAVVGEPNDSSLAENDDHNESGYQVMLEVRPEVQGIEFDPSGTLLSPLIRGDTLELRWRMNTQKVRDFSGRIWVYLVWISAGGAETRQTLFAIPVAMETVSFAGISATFLEKASVGGIAAGITFLILSFRKLI